MIKVFRQIRRRLIEQDNMGKYFKYAIGEIVLVVIGILIAISINNWNESTKNQRGTRDYLERLLNVIDINISQVGKEIEIEGNQIKASKKLLDLFHQDRGNLESKTVDSLISIVFSANAIDINPGIFTEGINGGKVGSLKSEHLRTALYGFVGILQDLKRQEEMWSNDLNNNFGGFLNKNFNYRQMDNAFGKYKGEIGPSYFESFNNLNVLNSMEFENHMDNRFFINRLQLESYKDLAVELRNIKNLISIELKQ